MKKDIFTIVFAAIGCALIAVGVFLLLTGNEKIESKPLKEVLPADNNNDEVKKIMTKEKTAKVVKEFTDKVYSDDVTEDDLKKYISSSLEKDDIFYGKDSYFRHMSDNLIEVEDINTKRDYYLSLLEKYMKDNFEYSLGDYVVSTDGSVIQNINVRSYYYKVFLLDYYEVVNKLKSFTSSTLTVVDQYRINVKALEIMSIHFDKYINKDEKVQATLIYTKENDKVACDYYSFYSLIGGIGYSHSSLLDSNRTSRVDDMIQDAINDGSLDTTNPVVLK